MTDFSAVGVTQTGRVEVLIRLDCEQPPKGTVVPLPDGEPPEGSLARALPFVGWLGLLRALAEVLNTTAESPGR